MEGWNWRRGAQWKGKRLKANKLNWKLRKVVVKYRCNWLVDLDRLRNRDVLGNVDGLDDMVNMDGGRRNTCCCC